MNECKIAFIICSHKEAELAEVLFYIDRLKIPEGFTREIVVVNHAKSMAGGYQYAMKRCDAKYKIYMHEDVFIINEDAVIELIKLFESYPKYSMLGVFGSAKLTSDGTLLTKKEDEAQIGNIVGIYFDTMETKRVWPQALGDAPIAQTAVLDGIFMATCIDIDWRDDIFKGWHYYDISQGFEFNKRGLNVGVINCKSPWLIHGSDRQTTGLSFEKYRVLFLREYADIMDQYVIKD